MLKSTTGKIPSLVQVKNKEGYNRLRVNKERTKSTRGRLVCQNAGPSMAVNTSWLWPFKNC